MLHFYFCALQMSLCTKYFPHRNADALRPFPPVFLAPP
jgi:hypothetical protein